MLKCRPSVPVNVVNVSVNVAFVKSGCKLLKRKAPWAGVPTNARFWHSWGGCTSWTLWTFWNFHLLVIIGFLKEQLR